MAFYKQSTAYTRSFFMVDSADHFSKKTGLTCTVNISKAGAAFGAAGGAVAEIANGWYKVSLSTTDTNTVGDLSFHVTATGADDTDFVDQVWVRDLADLAFPATSGRSMVVDASGLVDANCVKLGPTGAGTAQTAKDVGGAVPAVAAGASGGLLISGSNSGTTTLGALTVTGATTLTGNVSAAAGVTITQSTTNGSGLDITGNGTGAGIKSTGGATGQGVLAIGGGTSGDGIKVTTTSGHGLNLAPVGTNMHGALITGGNGGTSDGLKCVAGTGGTDIRATNITGTLATVTTATTATNLTNAPTSGDFTAAMKTSLNAATPAVTVSDKTGFSLTSPYDFAKGTAAMTESYAAQGATMTPVQALYQINQHLGESGIVSTTKTVKKRDGSTTAKTFTLNDATTPTAVTEAT